MLGVLIAVIVIIGAVVMLRGQSSGTTAPTDTTPTIVPESADGGASGGQDLMERETIVNVTKNGYEPSTVTVAVGSTVTWHNQSGSISNVSSDDHPSHLLNPFLNLGNFDDGESVSAKFEKAGTYPYHNHLDASQVGTVIVK